MNNPYVELESAIELLKKPEAILETLNDSRRDGDDVKQQEAKVFLESLSDEQLGEILPELFPQIANGLCENNTGIKTIYAEIKRKKADVKKSIDAEMIKTGVEIVKNSIEIIAAIIGILETLGYLDFLKKKQKKTKQSGKKRA